MRIAVLGHSQIHVRQQMFFQQVAALGHDVLVIAPGQWNELRVKPYQKGRFKLETCRHLGGNIGRFKLLGAFEFLRDFSPDWIYVQQEPGSELAQDSVFWKDKLNTKLALFTWENLHAPAPIAQSVLQECDLVICGNDDAERLVKAFAPRTKIMLQVGVDTDHFQARPDVPRDTSVGFVGRPVDEKGITKLKLAWPTAKILPWWDWRQLPWAYSTVRVIVAYSQDTPYWREQAPPYVAVEAMACECAVVASDAGSIPFWLDGCSGASVVPQNDTLKLRETIRIALDNWEARGKVGRSWVHEKMSSPIVAKELIRCLENL